MLNGRKLTKSFGDLTVLREVDVDLAPGSITTLVGPSGSGKSTLLRALSMLEPPDSGTISLNGSTYRFDEEHRSIDPPPWPDVTLVFQQLFLWPHLSLRENILLPIRARGVEADLSHVDELIHLFGMDQFADRYPNQVSLGQRQLAAIARALSLRPRCLLLDEITSALDVEYVSTILDRLLRLRDEGIAILLITHFIGFAKQGADQVLFMDHGQIVERGTPDILTKPETQRMASFLSMALAAT